MECFSKCEILFSRETIALSVLTFTSQSVLHIIQELFHTFCYVLFLVIIFDFVCIFMTFSLLPRFYVTFIIFLYKTCLSYLVFFTKWMYSPTSLHAGSHKKPIILIMYMCLSRSIYPYIMFACWSVNQLTIT